MALRSAARAFVTSCLQLVWPARCAGCDTLLPSDAALFCDGCGGGLTPIVGACLACAQPLGSLDAALVGATAAAGCAACAGRDLVFTRAFAALEYGEAVAAAIVRLKHGDRPDLAPRLARLFRGTVRRAVAPGTGAAPIDMVVPVPLHPRKLRRRGFNQALELARAALAAPARDLRATAPAWGSGGRPPALERQLLRRVRDTRELGRSGPLARREELAGAFAVAAGAQVGARLRGRRVLLIDDVMTTGATVNGCAEALLDGGAAEVRVAVLARAVL